MHTEVLVFRGSPIVACRALNVGSPKDCMPQIQNLDTCVGLRERYEAHHKLRYTDEALEAAATYSHQYISDRFLPDKAIDLIDEAGSRVRLRHAQLPEEAREVEKELRKIQKEKDSCVRTQVPTFFSPC